MNGCVDAIEKEANIATLGEAVERTDREVKVMMIVGGAEDIMKERAARQWAV